MRLSNPFRVDLETHFMQYHPLQQNPKKTSGHHHPYALMATAALACSFAFMLPVATPPNAIVFGSGYITIPQMAKAGVFMNLFGIVIITVITLYYLPIIWGIDMLSVPTWAR